MGKTITSYLLSDNPNGIKSVWVANRTCRCFYVTRNDLKIARERKELNQPSLYFLLGEEEVGEKKKAYIGETENFNDRIATHNNDKEKDFWNESLAFTANSLSKSEVQYLESLAIEKAMKAQNYSLENKKPTSYPHLEENRREIVEDFF